MYGYGDEETWPAYRGHYNDPRRDTEFDFMVDEYEELKKENAYLLKLTEELENQIADLNVQVKALTEALQK